MRKLMVFGGLLGLSNGLFAQEKTFEAITFADEVGVTYVAIKPIAYAMGWSISSDNGRFMVNQRETETPRRLLDGTRLVTVRQLKDHGFSLEVLGEGRPLRLVHGERQFDVRIGEKRVEINKAEQKLRAFQGEWLVAETPVSTGRRGFTTPSGTWSAGPEKSRMRYSRKYHNAPMPYSVQIYRGYFMHGYTIVPRVPASHGCVRMPMWGANAAKWVWNWIELGTEIRIANEWAAPRVGLPETIPIYASTLVKPTRAAQSNRVQSRPK